MNLESGSAPGATIDQKSRQSVGDREPEDAIHSQPIDDKFQHATSFCSNSRSIFKLTFVLGRF